MLTDSDVAPLVETLAPYASKWKNIGLQLGFTVSQLETIYSSHPGQNTMDYLRSMLSKWTHSPIHGKYATLEDLSSALRSNTVCLGTVADELAGKLHACTLSVIYLYCWATDSARM